MVDFARDAADIAIRLTVDPGPGFAADRLFPSAFAPMASPAFLAANPLHTPADLLTAARISPDDNWWRQWFETAGVTAPAAERRGALLLDSQVIEGASALAGNGVALLNVRFWAADLAAGRLVMPFPIVAESGACFWLVCPEARRNVPKIRQFRDWLLSEVATDQGSSSEPSP